MSDSPSIEPRSKVEIKTSTRGADVTVTVYIGTTQDDLQLAGNMAVAEYRRVVQELALDIMKAFVAEANRPR